MYVILSKKTKKKILSEREMLTMGDAPKTYYKDGLFGTRRNVQNDGRGKRSMPTTTHNTYRMNGDV